MEEKNKASFEFLAALGTKIKLRVLTDIPFEKVDGYYINNDDSKEGYKAFSAFSLEFFIDNLKENTNYRVTGYCNGNIPIKDLTINSGIKPPLTCKITIYYIDKEKNALLCGAETLEGIVGKSYSIDKKAFNGYIFKESTTLLEGVFPQKDTTISLYYCKEEVKPPPPKPLPKPKPIDAYICSASIKINDISNINVKDQVRELNGELKETTTKLNSTNADINLLKDKIKLSVSSEELESTKYLLNNNIDKVKKDADEKLTNLNYEITRVTKKAASLETNINGITGKVSSELNNYATKSMLSQTSREIKASFNEFGACNIVSNSRPTKTLNYWNASYDATANKSTITLATDGGENYQGEYFNSGLWFTTYRKKNSWCGIYNNSFQKYKFNTLSKYRLTFPIYSSQQKNCIITIRIARGDSQKGVFSKTITLSGNGYKLIDEIFIPQNVGDNPLFMIFSEDISDNTFYIPYVMLCEGEGNGKWTPNPNEIYNGITTIDGNGVRCDFNDGSYATMGHDGLELALHGATYKYHALAYVDSLTVPPGRDVSVWVNLPPEFKGKDYKIIPSLKGYYYNTTGNFFPFYVAVSHAFTKEDQKYGRFRIEASCGIQNADNANDVQYLAVNVTYIAIA